MEEKSIFLRYNKNHPSTSNSVVDNRLCFLYKYLLTLLLSAMWTFIFTLGIANHSITLRFLKKLKKLYPNSLTVCLDLESLDHEIF